MTDHLPLITHAPRATLRHAQGGLRHAPRWHYRRRRNGVLLLVVLTVLVLFVLLTVTYVIVATKERVTARAYSRYDQSGDPPNQIADSFAMTLFRDTTDVHSPFHTWSLLEGVYGNLSFRGNVGKQSRVCDGSGVGPARNNTQGQFYFIALDTVPTNFNPGLYYYSGCVLTMLSGPCAGCSARIVVSNGPDIPKSGDPAGFTVMRFKTDAGIDAISGKLIDPNPATNSFAGDAFLVNGPAYAGMGRGFDPNYVAGQMPPASQAPCGFTDPNGWEYALLPNPAFFQPKPAPSSGAYPAYTDPAGWSGANVDYTAYDYNNMFLGLITNDLTKKLPPILPSFHRSDLWTYWADRIKNSGGAIDPLTVARKILFRPNPTDHPIFCQMTNPAFNQTPYPGVNTTDTTRPPLPPLDVDNVGLGTPDSIWIDPGLPVMTAKDGRTYKILVAPLILDLDGRVNLNAHGSVAQSTIAAIAQLKQASQGPLAGSTKAGVNLPPGMGFGPADIDLTQVMSTKDVNNLFGVGNKNPPGTYNPSAIGSFQGRHGWGMSPVSDRALTMLKFFEYPVDDYRYPDNTFNLLSSFGTPGDLKGQRTCGVDYRGQPLWITPGSNPTNATNWAGEVFDVSNMSNPRIAWDTPYGIDLHGPRPGRQVPQGLDNPFTVAELEPVLRPFDIDTRSLPNRLYGASASLLQDTIQTYLGEGVVPPYTTESWDVPVPSVVPPNASYRTLMSKYWTALYGKNFLLQYPEFAGRGFQVADLLRARLYFNYLKLSPAPFTSSTPPAKVQAILDQQITILLPAEMLAALKMDINRPFGNGRDDANSGVVDYPGSVATNAGGNQVVAGEASPETIKLKNYPNQTRPNPYGDIPLDVTAGLAYKQPQLARQLMARYLYVLGMLCSDFSNPSFKDWANLNDASAQAHIQALNARRVAQWAINAVCFRDSSSVMTPFVYHSHFLQSDFAGWTVKGDPNEAKTSGPDDDIQVVWGCKPPDLVMTETLAFHDRRTADTTLDDQHHARTDDTDPMKKDTNFDQIQIPQGSLFVELYCCRNPSNPIAPADLYTFQNGAWYLDLGKQAPDASGNAGKGMPVWRMTVLSHLSGNNQNAEVEKLAASYPDTVAYQSGADDTVTNRFTMKLNALDPTITAKVDRVIWLGKNAPPPAIRSNVFYNRNQQAFANANNTVVQNTLVPLGAYAVVGPRQKTAVGSVGIQTGTQPGPNNAYGKPAPQQFWLTATAPGVKAQSTANDTPNASSMKPITVPIIAAADAPDGTNGSTPWKDPSHTNANFGIGVNVSEPLPNDGNKYYKEPTTSNPNAIDPSYNVDAYGDLTGAGGQTFPDKPFEGTTDPDPLAISRPLVQDQVNKTGNHPLYKFVFLQRLADPNAPWDAVSNPYITVDWMPIDLTTFNGGQPWDGKAPDPDDPGADPAKLKIQFCSRQRGGSRGSKLAGAQKFNLWPPVHTQPDFQLPPQGDADQLPNSTKGGTGNFSFLLDHSLGILNEGFGTAFTTTNQPAPGYVGDPQKPFPWIPWNARPYANAMELLLVPSSSPDRLLNDFTSPGTELNPPPTPYTVPSTPQSFHGPFGHLFNFFSSAAPPDYKDASAANLFMMLDYLTVPSRFIGSETVLNPTVFKFVNNGSGLYPFVPPFNTVSNYRDPGRMNINTITSMQVLSALLGGPNGQPGPPATLYENFVNSRRGDGDTSQSLITNKSVTYPTSVAAPFRGAASADLVPVKEMLHPRVNATLLRPNSAGQAPLFGSNSNVAFNSIDPKRNSYFYYDGLERIGGNFTTRSNVFAVWLTIGYFEVLPWPQPGINGTGPFTAADYAAHADGYQLGAELGSDTGEVTRHRAFYIFDRSIPVGYERGQNHNVNRAILLRRYIE